MFRVEGVQGFAEPRIDRLSGQMFKDFHFEAAIACPLTMKEAPMAGVLKGDALRTIPTP